MLEVVQVTSAGAAEEVTWEARQTLLLMNTKQTIKGILGSFTLIDQHWRWVKGPLESGGVIH